MEPIECVFIHHTCRLPQNMLPRLWKDKEHYMHSSFLSKVLLITEYEDVNDM